MKIFVKSDVYSSVYTDENLIFKANVDEVVKTDADGQLSEEDFVKLCDFDNIPDDKFIDPDYKFALCDSDDLSNAFAEYILENVDGSLPANSTLHAIGTIGVSYDVPMFESYRRGIPDKPDIENAEVYYDFDVDFKPAGSK